MTDRIESLLRPPARCVLVYEDGQLTSEQAERITIQWNRAVDEERWPLILSGHWRWLDEPKAETEVRDLDADAELFALTREPGESDDDLRYRVQLERERLSRPVVTEDFIALLEQHRPLNVSLEALLTAMLNHVVGHDTNGMLR